MITHQEVAERTGTEIPPHLIAQAEVPVATNWRQGDVYVMKHAAGPKGTGIDISDRNSHILNGDGMFYPGQYRDRFDFGLLLVPAATDENPTPLAVLTHTDEHGSVAFGPGSYRVFGQVSHEQELQRAVD